MKKRNGKRRHAELLLLLTSLLPTYARTQSLQEDLFFLLNRRPAHAVFNIKGESAPEPLNLQMASELEMLFVNTIRAYQAAVSSQDLPTCGFTPSCSRFSNAALQQAGWWRGLLLTSDRLQRCHGLPGTAHHYPLRRALGKFSDPVERYWRDFSEPTHDH